MFTIMINVLFALVVTLFATAPVTAEQHWGNFKKDQCTGIGKRQWSAVLLDIPWGKSWKEACDAMPATVNGHDFSTPTRCKNTGQMWGEFDVSDESCSHSPPPPPPPPTPGGETTAPAPDQSPLVSAKSYRRPSVECDAEKVTLCKSLLQDQVPWTVKHAHDPSFRHWQEGNMDNLCRCTPNAATTVQCFQNELDKNGDSWEAAIKACRAH